MDGGAASNGGNFGFRRIVFSVLCSAKVVETGDLSLEERGDRFWTSLVRGVLLIGFEKLGKLVVLSPDPVLLAVDGTSTNVGTVTTLGFPADTNWTACAFVQS